MANTYLTRTQANGTSSQKFTISCWVKRGGLSATQAIWGSGSATNDGCDLAMTRTDELTYESWYGSNNPKIITTRKFRDSSAWYHIVLAVDTTQATDTNRVKIYVNGVQETAFGTSNYPSQNYNLAVSTTNDVMKFGVGGQYATSYWNGLITHAHFIDGLQYQASDFGESDSVSGIWKPKTAPSVTYGTNGVFLKFENSGAMGTDSSGNTNTFAVGGGTLTQNVDTPSNNFATMNPVIKTGGAYSQGNNTFTDTSGSYNTCFSTIGMFKGHGKYYAEFKVVSGTSLLFGIADYKQDGVIDRTQRGETRYLGEYANSYGYQRNGNFYYSGSSTSTGYDSFTTNDIIGLAVDMDNMKIYWHKNGTYQNSKSPASNNGETIVDPEANYHMAISVASSVANVNFGNGYFGTTAVASAGTSPSEGGIFEHDCPSGYQSLCTKGINSF